MHTNFVFRSIEEVTPERLTAVLPYLVTHVHVRDNPAFNSQVYHLILTYIEGTPDTAPRHILLKLNGSHAGKLEHDFYHTIQSLPEGTLSVPACWHAAYDLDSGDSSLILEDLSANFQPPVIRQQLLNGEGVPTAVHLHQIIDSLAQFHAFWWQHPRLGTGDGIFAIRSWYADQEHYQAHIERRKQEWAQFYATAPRQDLNADIFELFPTILKHLPMLWTHYLEPRLSPPSQITLSHGDCYLTQFLCPQTDTNRSAIVVDFDSVSANFAAFDLVYLLTTFWTPEQRRQYETTTLHRYHQTLLGHGVKNYAWEQLWLDYRLMVLFMIFDPIWDQTNGSSLAYWQPKLDCLTSAFKDLNCQELFT